MAARSAKSKPGISPVYLLGGTDSFLVEQQVRQLVGRLITPDEKQMAFWQPSENDLPPVTEILDELRTLPFLASRRVVLIKNAEDFIAANRSQLEKYLENPSPTGILILVVNKVDSRTRLTKAISKLCGVMETGSMKSSELPAFASGYCRQHYDKILNPVAAQMLVQFVGDETGQICSEIDKLTIYVGDKKSITPEDVQLLVGQNRMFDAFEVIDAMMMQKNEESLKRLRNMFESDRESEYKVIGAFAFHFRRLFSARALLDKGHPEQTVAKKLGIWGTIQGRFFTQVHLIKLGQLGKILAKLGQVDFLIKTGRTTAPSAMERLVIQIEPLFSAR